jgi:hypothetical protein
MCAGVISAVIGGHWDISWHRSIGRDTFWTPAHIAIYMCGVLAGLSSGQLILSSTFGRSKELAAKSVSVFGFKGPLGAFACAWGGIAMLTAAPFDDWWHNTYGLDVKILSPPHTVLAAGILAVHLGALLLVLSERNRTRTAHATRLLLFVGGLLLVSITMFLMEITGRWYMHTAHFYRDLAFVAPVLFVALSRATEHRFAATAIAAVYTTFMLGFEWILPLFSAEPKLAPVYVHVTHFIPPSFPLLLIVPAFAIDLARPKLERFGPGLKALILGLIFLVSFAAAQATFADFLMSPASENWIFGTGYVDYATPPARIAHRHSFVAPEVGLELAVNIALALAAAIGMTRVGLAAGEFMQRIKR